MLAALVLLAFSLEGLPEPLDPGPVTIDFDGAQAARDTRALIELSPSREPGSAGDRAAADFVRDSFVALKSGGVSEQRFAAEISGEDVTLRNVVLTLPGRRPGTIVVIAGRDAVPEPGSTVQSAAATGVLLALAQQLGVSDLVHSVVLASTDGSSAGSLGVRELVGGLEESAEVRATVVVARPGAVVPKPPHLLTGSSGHQIPSPQLVRTAADALRERADVEAGLEGLFGQLARLAVPAAVGEQAALNAEGFDAVAISSHGEVDPVTAAQDEEPFTRESLARFGAAALATIVALDATPAAPEQEPDTYLRLSGNMLAGGVIGFLVLTLLLPPAAVAAAQLARASRLDEGAGAALRWAVSWALLPLVPLLALYALALVGLVPDPESPFVPDRFRIGVSEVLALAFLVALPLAVWWALAMRRVPSRPSPMTLAAACAAIASLACLALWFANPVGALVALPPVHLIAVHLTGTRTARALILPAAALAVLPAMAALIYVGSQLEWGISAPWQLVLLVAGGGAPPLDTLAFLALCAATVAATWATLAPRRVSRTRPPQAG